MSVSLLEVIEAGGYDLQTREDAIWLLSKQSEFEELIEQAEELVENSCELCGVSPMTANCNNANCS